MEGFSQICFTKNTVSNPNIVVGDYSHHNDPEESENLETKNTPSFSNLGSLTATDLFGSRHWRGVGTNWNKSVGACRNK